MPRDPVAISDAHRDRAVGTLLGTAVGDALAGAGESHAPGLWTGPTAMAIAVAEFTSTGVGLDEEIWQDRLVERWAWWEHTATEVCPQTRAVLATARENTAEAAREAAAVLNERTGRTLDGSCLTRPGPATLCALTHAGSDAGDACRLWDEAIRHAVTTGRLDIRIGLCYIDTERRGRWESRIADAEEARPQDFADGDDGVVSTFQAAWSAIATTAEPAEDPAAGVFAVDRLRLALESAATGTGEAHSVAAAAGALLGSAYGASAIPALWRVDLKGWPGLNAHLLVGLADRILNGGQPRRAEGLDSWRDCPPPKRHPHDDGVWIGAAARLERLPEGTDAVVSLCQLADGHIPARIRHLEAPLIDDAGANPNLDFVLLDTVRAIEALRAEGATVFLHSHTGRSRAPAVAALYGARRAGISVDQALDEVCALTYRADPSREFRTSLRRLHPAIERAPR